MKIVLKTENDEKKLLGTINFDVSTYANQQPTKTFKEKKELEQMPKNVKGYISYQVSLEYLGDGSEAPRSKEKSEKRSARNESPLNKFVSLFTSNNDEDGSNGKKSDED
jgi:hypothetical protein